MPVLLQWNKNANVLSGIQATISILLSNIFSSFRREKRRSIFHHLFLTKPEEKLDVRTQNLEVYSVSGTCPIWPTQPAEDTGALGMLDSWSESLGCSAHSPPAFVMLCAWGCIFCFPGQCPPRMLSDSLLFPLSSVTKWAGPAIHTVPWHSWVQNRSEAQEKTRQNPRNSELDRSSPDQSCHR